MPHQFYFNKVRKIHFTPLDFDILPRRLLGRHSSMILHFSAQKAQGHIYWSMMGAPPVIPASAQAIILRHHIEFIIDDVRDDAVECAAPPTLLLDAADTAGPSAGAFGFHARACQRNSV